MNLGFTPDQQALLDAVDKLVAREQARAGLAPVRAAYAPALQQQLAEAGYLGSLPVEELGPVAGAATVMALARLPQCVEALASCLVAPQVCPDRPGPFALVHERLDQPFRFAPVARTLVRVQPGAVQVAALAEGDVEPLDSLFAYPMGRLRTPHALPWQDVPQADAQAVLHAWRVGLAAELAGCLAAALDCVVQHVKDRRQFGRPLGAFQAVQHRLAECATALAAARWLALRAAGTGAPADGCAAAGYAQDMATRIAYDLHQFMGAMGLTLEHPLHRWTYRSKLLRAELGGAAAHFAQLADAAWTTPRATEAHA